MCIYNMHVITVCNFRLYASVGLLALKKMCLEVYKAMNVVKGVPSQFADLASGSEVLVLLYERPCLW